MLPKVVVHNSVSIDGSLTGFVPSMEMHYGIANAYRPEVHLIGSATVKAGIEMYGNGVPPEEKSDFERPDRYASLPWWVVVDSRGSTMGLLHAARRFEYCRDIVVLVSRATPKDFLQRLKNLNPKR